MLRLKHLFTYLDANPNSRCINEGEAVLNAGHIVTCGRLHGTATGDNTVNVYGLCLQTSAITSPPHEIKGSFVMEDSDTNVSICSMVCSCKAGEGGRCKHIAAILLYCTRSKVSDLEPLSSTDLKCTWSQKKGIYSHKYKALPLLEDSCFKEKAPINLELDIEESASVLKVLQEFAPSNSALNLYGTNISSKNEAIPALVDTSFINRVFENAASGIVYDTLDTWDIPDMNSCCVDTYNTSIASDMCNAQVICKNTLLNDKIWQRERQYRVTGSRAYALYTYKGTDWKRKAIKYFWPKMFSNKYVEHGLNEERSAILRYQEVHNTVVHKIGLFVQPDHSWLAYSPDGVTADDNNNPKKLIEIKCPFAGKHQSVLNIIDKCKFLKIIDGEICLNKKHTYFGQIQFGMSVLNLQSCDFIVYSSYDNSLLTLNITHDVSWSEQFLSKLQVVYFTKMLHCICENKEILK